jgi:cell wall-associated NlpC family hydrolase
VEKTRLQTGDLLFFSDNSRSIGHVAIYLADGKFVHATTGKGVIVSHLDEK